ncbi:MAG TPA: hypothetical protein VFH24_03560 [Gemmatimonadales bacterium]|nr:hypothetical protein [Gemmatimonadales bacterium]
MRPVLLLPLALIVVASGCDSQRGREVATAPPARDLALPAQTPRVEIASPVELGRAKASEARRPARRAPRRTRPAASTILPAVLRSGPEALPVNIPRVETVSLPTPANDRELPPGKTVTIIPASSGPSTSSDGVDDLPPSEGRPIVRGGGTCRGRGRGPGIGIATRPRPGLH